MEGIRINKFLSEAGVCSRREADRHINEGNVKIDGVTAVIGAKVMPGSKVSFFESPLKTRRKGY